jgi:hypothetical protein
VYADAILPLDHGLRTRAAALMIPPYAVITGISAAWLWGARLASPEDPVDVLLPPGPRYGPVTGLRTRTSPLAPEEVDVLAGIRVTTPLRTAWELAMRLDPVEAVVYCDALSALGRFGVAELRDYLGSRAGRYGCRLAKRVFSLVDDRAESPQESRLRVHLIRAGLPPPVPQYEVHRGGTLVARVDLAWPECRFAVEYDGVWHANAKQLVHDRRRLNHLQAAGWYIHHVTVRDMADIGRLTRQVARIFAARTEEMARASSLAGASPGTTRSGRG